MSSTLTYLPYPRVTINFMLSKDVLLSHWTPANGCLSTMINSPLHPNSLKKSVYMMSHEFPLSIMILDALKMIIIAIITNGNTSTGTSFTFSLSLNPKIGLLPLEFTIPYVVYDPTVYLFMETWAVLSCKIILF